MLGNNIGEYVLAYSSYFFRGMRFNGSLRALGACRVGSSPATPTINWDMCVMATHLSLKQKF